MTVNVGPDDAGCTVTACGVDDGCTTKIGALVLGATKNVVADSGAMVNVGPLEAGCTVTAVGVDDGVAVTANDGLDDAGAISNGDPAAVTTNWPALVDGVAVNVPCTAKPEVLGATTNGVAPVVTNCDADVDGTDVTENAPDTRTFPMPSELL